MDSRVASIDEYGGSRPESTCTAMLSSAIHRLFSAVTVQSVGAIISSSMRSENTPPVLALCYGILGRDR
jgi:hypothetical protein